MLRRLLSALERPVCRTIGCSSWFSRRWKWPHRFVCSTLVDLAHPEYRL